MSDDAGNDMLKGSCLCGAVSIALSQKSRDIEVCHCDMCRSWSGGPLFTLHGDKDDAPAITGMEHVSAYRSSDWAERAFCGRCGSSLWYHFIPADTRAFMAGLFPLPAGYAVSEQIFVDQRPGWARLAAQSHEKTGAQVIAEAEAAGFDFD